MNNIKGKILSALFSAVLTYLTVLCVYFMDLVDGGTKNLIIIAAAALGIITVVFCFLGKKEVFRLLFICLVFSSFFGALFLLLDKSGFWNNVSSVDAMQEFIRSQGAMSYLVFLLIQFLQVVAVPIPGAVTVAAGVLVYGFFWGTVLSFVGIVLGSLVAFIIGRRYGYKLVVWVIGEKNLIKTLELIKGRDKVIFAMMFLLPFFPDDMLCFVAGLTPMSFGFFAAMLATTRVVTTLTLAFSTHFSQQLLSSGSVISYLVFGLFIVAIAVIFILSVRYGDKVQYWYENKLFKKAETSGKKSGVIMEEKDILQLSQKVAVHRFAAAKPPSQSGTKLKNNNNENGAKINNNKNISSAELKNNTNLSDAKLNNNTKEHIPLSKADGSDHQAAAAEAEPADGSNTNS